MQSSQPVATDLQHSHTDLRSSPDEPVRTTRWRPGCPACLAFGDALAEQEPVLLVHLATGPIATACGKLPGSFEVDHHGRPVRHTAHLSLSADPADWPPPLECCPTCWEFADDHPATGRSAPSGMVVSPNNEEDIMDATAQTTERLLDIAAPVDLADARRLRRSYPCPPWCRLPPGHGMSAPWWEPDGIGLDWGREHSGPEWSLQTPRGVVSVSVSACETLDNRGRSTIGPAALWVSERHEGMVLGSLTGSEARELAALLCTAADELDRVAAGAELSNVPVLNRGQR